MKTLEALHLRLAGEERGTLVDLIRRCVETDEPSIDVRIFGHATLATDLVVHLHREAPARATRTSDLGVRLAALLRNYGMVEHSVWSRLFPRSESKGS
jgi:hypothetical protein